MCLSASIVSLYTVAYFARFVACVLVARSMSPAFSLTVPERNRNIILLKPIH